VRKKYKPEIIKCQCHVCEEFISNFVVPYQWEKPYCWNCLKAELEKDSELKLVLESTKLFLKKMENKKQIKEIGKGLKKKME